MSLRRLFCYFFIIFILFAGINTAFAIEDDDLFNPVEIKDGMELSIIDCVSLAFKNSPKIKRQKYNLIPITFITIPIIEIYHL